MNFSPRTDRFFPPYEPGAHIGLHLPTGISPRIFADPALQSGRRLSRRHQARPRQQGRLALHPRGFARRPDPRYRAAEKQFPAPCRREPAVLIAGGIGVTPIWCMAQHLAAAGRPFELHYACARARRRRFLPRCERSRRTCILHVDVEAGGTFLDVAGIVKAAPAHSHLYCCGPLPMLEAFEKAMEPLPVERRHVEYFSSPNAPAVEGGFTVVLARSGREIPDRAGRDDPGGFARGRPIRRCVLRAGRVRNLRDERSSPAAPITATFS